MATQSTIPATEKQLDYLANLKRTALEEQHKAFQFGAPHGQVGFRARCEAVAKYLLTLAMPEPATISEASDQIDCLVHGTALTYAKEHQAWAQPIIARGAALFGDDMSRLPESWDGVVAMIEGME